MACGRDLRAGHSTTNTSSQVPPPPPPPPTAAVTATTTASTTTAASPPPAGALGTRLTGDGDAGSITHLARRTPPTVKTVIVGEGTEEGIPTGDPTSSSSSTTPISPSSSSSSSAMVDLGELLLFRLLRIPPVPATTRLGTTTFTAAATAFRVKPIVAAMPTLPDGTGVLLVAVLCMVASELALLLELPERPRQFIGGILLAASAGTLYLALCCVLATFERTAVWGRLLLRRSSPWGWRRDRLRFFLEVCSWMASVWYAYMATHSEWLAIVGGAITATLLAVCSDVTAAYVRVLEARLHRRTEASVAWLKVGLSYLCVGYVLTGSWRNLYGFLWAAAGTYQSLEELVFNYLLITLVGVSLIVASELLLLYEPTRHAGIVLQSRIVDARRNWEERTWRSLVEATAVFGATVVAYHVTTDMLISLQLGTLTGVVGILSGEAYATRGSGGGRSVVFAPHPRALPGDHWVKLLPPVAMMTYFFVQVCSAIAQLVQLQSEFGVMLVTFVTVLAIALTVLPFLERGEVARIGRRIGATVCVVVVSVVAWFVCEGWLAIFFSASLSWFCSSLSRECWDEIEARERHKARQSMDRAPEALEGSVMTSFTPRPQSTMGLIRVGFPYLYTRVKWTFISIVLLSIVDVCSTGFLVLKYNTLQVSLSQFSAWNVVVSTGIGYLTSCIRQELRPEVLAQTGFSHFKNRWMLYPLHAFVETTVFVAVFIGTFAATSTWFSSLTLASLSGIVVSVGGHWLCSQLNLTVGNRLRIQLTGTCALVFCVFLFSWVSFLCLFSIYHHIDNIEAAFCLASLAGIFFLASSEVFLLWEPTREIGRILQHRVTHARENWEAEPLRSFLELFTWLAVICGSFALYDDLLLALQLGTFSGIAVSLSGEYYRSKRSKILQWNSLANAPPQPFMFPASSCVERPRLLPAMLLFAYIGSGTFQWIFENIRSIEVTVLLATLAGFAFLCIGDLLVLYEPTRWAGVMLQDRFLRAKENWNENPVRSFVELGCFLGVIYGSYAIYGDFLVATQVGIVSGMLVTLIGEQVRTHARSIPPADDDSLSKEKTQVLALPVMGLLGLVGAVAFNIIYTHLRSIEVAFVLATMSGVAFALLGDMFVIWKPTRRVGLILQERIVYLRYNMKMHPRRTWLELGSCAAALYGSYVFVCPGDLLIAMQMGTFTGIAVCVCHDLIVEYLANVERSLTQVASNGKHNAQENSGFLALPYEVQFQIAHYLAPEDLLIARATCHRINTMLRAESARYWLHASIRRRFGRKQRAERAGAKRQSKERFLIVEAFRSVLPKLFSARDPSEVLTSGIGVSRALKWVYLNADWIRSQGLRSLDKEQLHCHTVTFHEGDMAFEVFRHMPDKHNLGISVVRCEDNSIRAIDVPVAVYTNIQTDPLSFVAAETLSEVDAFTNWHVAFVAFFAMTLIFIGQFSSDVLRQYVFPQSFWWPG